MKNHHRRVHWNCQQNLWTPHLTRKHEIHHLGWLKLLTNHPVCQSCRSSHVRRSVIDTVELLHPAPLRASWVSLSLGMQTEKMRCLIAILDWVLVSNIFYFHPEPSGNDPIWLIFFKWGWFNHQLVDVFFSKSQIFFGGNFFGRWKLMGKTHPLGVVGATKAGTKRGRMGWMVQGQSHLLPGG